MRLRGMYKIIAGALLLLLAALGGLFFFFKNKNSSNTVACTMEAKLCPDGSYVGRVGPECKFALCPGESEPTTTHIPNTAPPPVPDGPVVIRTWVGHRAAGGGVSVTPTEVAEDSRCPVGVTCIQAGTVRIKTTVETTSGKKSTTLTLGEPLELVEGTLTLSDVQPVKTKSHTIAQNEYKISFTFEKKK